MRVETIVILMLLACGCSAPEGETDGVGTWVGTITTEGDVTTVVNESGSVWGGTATLVEEASVGVDTGENPYMLGTVSGVAADRDRMYVLDSQAPALRIYDLAGNHLRDIGSEGQGPGEYSRPDGLAVGPDGRIYVRVFQLQRINVYGRDGTNHAPLSGAARIFQGGPLRVMADGVVYSRTRDGYLGLSPESRDVPSIARAVFDEQPLTVRTAGIPEFMSPAVFNVPFSPNTVQQLSPAGALVAGFSNAYRIEVRFSGDTKTVIERVVTPISLAGDESAWYEGYIRERLINRGPVEGTIPPTPETKPFFSMFLTTHDGRIWVVRPGPGERQADCAPLGADLRTLNESPCWSDGRIVDVFEIDGGRYLGRVDFPDGLRTNPEPHIDGDRVIGVVEDEFGTIMVKRYRLVLPGGAVERARER